MPPRKRTVDHRHGGGGKHISSIADVQARNNGEESAYDRARRERVDGKEEDGGAKEEQKIGPVKVKATGLGGLEVENPNAVRRNEDRDGVELTRKQREEIEKNASRRRYEELHKAGKTDEAKADLGRLEEVKKRREEALQKRKEDEDAIKAKEAGVKKTREQVLAEELKKTMGDGESRKIGGKKKKDDKEDDDNGEPKVKLVNGVDEKEVYGDYADTFSSKKATAPTNKEKVQEHSKSGSIEDCRAAEDDFM